MSSAKTKRLIVPDQPQFATNTHRRPTLVVHDGGSSGENRAWVGAMVATAIEKERALRVKEETRIAAEAETLPRDLLRPPESMCSKRDKTGTPVDWIPRSRRVGNQDEGPKYWEGSVATGEVPATLANGHCQTPLHALSRDLHTPFGGWREAPQESVVFWEEDYELLPNPPFNRKWTKMKVEEVEGDLSNRVDQRIAQSLHVDDKAFLMSQTINMRFLEDAGEEGGMHNQKNNDDHRPMPNGLDQAVGALPSCEEFGGGVGSRACDDLGRSIGSGAGRGRDDDFTGRSSKACGKLPTQQSRTVALCTFVWQQSGNYVDVGIHHDHCGFILEQGDNGSNGVTGSDRKEMWYFIY
ncbi:hypothetical protein BDK51DRAFT_34845 [Blyttiomyces helicus]|uniref:Uncharacterized protein n=1 Tax=Blyttiomyces helicus TaxID=388810 RepID=A0A4P9WDT1_9FUNG|nr:hypothetical protein BDK51DRAFT_34845 [Blyttiomyces helicus]|eukprot:RKO90724.1 hypothetical protein BDK51DRAFT_34845 [Blyttiomyces helicus]